MRSLYKKIRQIRKKLGLSQANLGHLSGVSLATIQNVEAGKANPSLSTLESLLRPLGLTLSLGVRGADWDTLCALGLPLVTQGAKRLRPSGDLLAEHVRLGLLELTREVPAKDHERKVEGLQALVLALMIHFPTYFRHRMSRSRLIETILPKQPSGRVIKLARLAVRTLSEYL
jgi:transcriptional regulator with XRE-family HTH domain